MLKRCSSYLLAKGNSPHTKEVADADICQDDETSSSYTLYHSTSDEHFDVDGQSRDQRSNEENNIGEENDGFATPDVTELSPGGDACSCCQQECGSYPCIVCLR